MSRLYRHLLHRETRKTVLTPCSPPLTPCSPPLTGTTTPTCPLCGRSAGLCYTAGAHRLYRSNECRTAFVHPTPSDEFLSDFYARYHLSDEEGGQYDDVESRMQADFGSKIAMIRRFAGAAGSSPSGRLLDVGCGKGFFVKACVDDGLEAEGIDLSDSGVEYATEELGVAATCGSLEEIGPTLGSFGTITFWATIEHLPRPVQMLEAMRSRLEPGGHLFLDTGIGDDWLDRLLPGQTQWYDPPQHLFVFSAAGMRCALEAAGLELVHLDPCFERSALRKVVRNVRNGTTAALLRASATLGRLRGGTYEFTRYPMGNLMSVVARRPEG